MSLPGAACALEKDGGVRAEFVNYLAARSTWRTGHALVVGNSYSLNFDRRTEVATAEKMAVRSAQLVMP